MIQLGLSPVVRTKALPPLKPLSPTLGGWWPIIRESFTGAWQRNVEVRSDTALSYFAVYSCVRLIATDIGKLCLRLVREDEPDIWTPTENPAFSPVLRKPNRYQTIHKFVEQWMLSKLIHGNTYVLKARDGRGLVRQMYVLEPTRVTPLVTNDGAVYYELRRDDLSGLRNETITVPASEIIHDTMIAPFHPLIGLSPLYAAALGVTQGLSIGNNSSSFFTNGSMPGGLLTVPGDISDDDAAKMKAQWESSFSGDNMGKVALLTGGMTYTPIGFINSRDSQMVEQMQVTAQQICSVFGVPPYLVDIGDPPPYANFEPLLLKYHSQCIQSHTVNVEAVLDDGMGILEKIDGTQYGTEFDIDDLIWMDTATRVESAKNSIGGGGMSMNEGRKKYHGLGPVRGGDVPYLQEQNWPISLLSARELPSRPPTAPADVVEPDEDDNVLDMAAMWAALNRKSIEVGLYAA